MTDLEITKLCAEAIGFKTIQYVTGDGCLCHASGGLKHDFYFNPIHDDAQLLALVKRLSLQIHHHGCADAKASLVTVTGMWLPGTRKFSVCANNLNRAACECTAVMQKAKS